MRSPRSRRSPHLHHAGADDDRADTDVFAAVRQPGADDSTQTAPVATEQTTRREDQA
jgi:hypothetical protein